VDHSIFLIDDDRIFATIFEKKFKEVGWDFRYAMTAAEGLSLLKEKMPDVVLVDVFLPDRLGVDLIADIKALDPAVPILIVSVSGEPQHVIAAIKNGASDYVTKPVEFPALFQKVQSLVEFQKIKQTESKLESLKDERFVFGPSAGTKQLLHEISRVACFDSTVLLRGETGVGKSMVAQLIHELGPRKKKNFVEVNCSAIPEQLLESELFGHEKGAFNGANREKQGKFEIADGGSIFLDEIGDLAPELQTKLLRILQGGELERVGGLKTSKVDVRVIASTNQNLEEAIEKGRLREDLFYRLNVLPIFIPPLRERRDDILFLVTHYLKVFSLKMKKRFEKPSPEILERLASYNWPGNIRELQNVVERCVVLGKEPQFELKDFALGPAPRDPARKYAAHAGEEEVSFKSLRELEHKSLMEALKRSSGNIARAARFLGISRGTIYRRLRKYEIGLKLA